MKCSLTLLKFYKETIKWTSCIFLHCTSSCHVSCKTPRRIWGLVALQCRVFPESCGLGLKKRREVVVSPLRWAVTLPSSGLMRSLSSHQVNMASGRDPVAIHSNRCFSPARRWSRLSKIVTLSAWSIREQSFHHTTLTDLCIPRTPRAFRMHHIYIDFEQSRWNFHAMPPKSITPHPKKCFHLLICKRSLFFNIYLTTSSHCSDKSEVQD